MSRAQHGHSFNTALRAIQFRKTLRNIGDAGELHDNASQETQEVILEVGVTTTAGNGSGSSGGSCGSRSTGTGAMGSKLALCLAHGGSAHFRISLAYSLGDQAADIARDLAVLDISERSADGVG